MDCEGPNTSLQIASFTLNGVSTFEARRQRRAIEKSTFYAWLPQKMGKIRFFLNKLHLTASQPPDAAAVPVGALCGAVTQQKVDVVRKRRGRSQTI